MDGAFAYIHHTFKIVTTSFESKIKQSGGEDMHEESFWYHTNDQHKLHVKYWGNTTQPMAIVQIAHGMAEHIERYQEFATYLVKQDFIVYGHDHRGHGKTGESANSLGFFAEKHGFERVVEDSIEVTEFIKEEHPDTPVFLLGYGLFY